jgi:hypothetical protein
LADETNKAFRAITGNPDWCFYIQGDEVLHEKYHDVIREGMERWKDDPEVDGLLLNTNIFTARSIMWPLLQDGTAMKYASSATTRISILTGMRRVSEKTMIKN